jgi:hypothetical protein
VARRLKPTYGLDYDEKHTNHFAHSKNKGLGISSEHHKFFKHFNNTNPRSVFKEPSRKGSSGSLRSTKKHDASSTSLVALGNGEAEKKRFNLGSASAKKDKKDKAANDDLSQMMSRASNYMTLAHVRLNSFVVCLSYKGKSDRNFEDLHDFVFRMPTLEYRNKTWSNLDLALRLKKDVIRALISHTGAIIGNKFTHHRPNKKQVERLKEIAHSSTIPNSDINLQLSGTSETTSLYSFSQDGKDDDLESGITFQSPPGTNGPHKNGTFHGPSPLLRSGSWSSGINTPNIGATGSTVMVPTARSIPGTAGSVPTSGSGASGIFSSTSSLFSQRRPSSAHPSSVPSSSPGLAMTPTITPTPPSTSHGPARSLLKDTIGRHFSGDTVKARVHFGGLSLIKSESHKEKEHNRERSESQSSHKDKDKDKDRDREREKTTAAAAHSADDVFTEASARASVDAAGGGTGTPARRPSLAGALAGPGGNEADGTERDTDIHRRKSVLMLGKKVLNRLS